MLITEPSETSFESLPHVSVRNLNSHYTICLTRVRVFHAVSDKRVLKLRAHEAISVPASVQDPKVDLEHRHIEQ
jgi:hypothetical protein